MAKRKVFLLNDSSDTYKTVAKALKKLNCEPVCFADGKDCLEKLRTKTCDLLIVDGGAGGIDNIGLVSEAGLIAPGLSILAIVHSGDVPLAVRAVNSGAADVIEEPLRLRDLLGKVRSIFEKKTLSVPSAGKLLSGKEMSVLRLILRGISNREIGGILGRSVRTIEDHRSHIMRKLGVHNTVGLVKKAAAMGLIKISE